jgi:RimJ/RimL family protein N-acetyltransferase
MTSPQIETERLVLTRLESRDAETLFRYRSDPSVTRYQSWAPRSLEEAARFIRDQESVDFDAPGTWFQFAMRSRESARLVGDLGVRFPPDDIRQVEIGFTVAPDHQRRGYGIEAVTGLLDFLFEVREKHRVFASVDPRNEASIALLQRIGLRREAHFRQSLWIGGEWVDDVVYAILRSEWSGR